MNVTGKDLAKMLGVSQSTISMVVNNKPGISETRREEILAKLKDLNYMKMVSASSEAVIAYLSYKRTGIVMNDYPSLSEGISTRARKCNYSFTIAEVTPETVETKLVELQEIGVVGIIVDAVEMKEENLAPFIKCGIPFVIFNNSFISQSIDTVEVNNVQGVFKSLTYLKSLGHTRIGFIHSTADINSFNDRLEIYNRILVQLGLEHNPDDIYTVSYSQIGGYDDMKNIIEQKRNSGLSMPTAFITDNDMVAFAAIHAFQSCGYKVPGDISIIGFDDRPICQHCDPQITTLRIPRLPFGETATQLLIDNLQNDNDSTMTVQIGVSLVIRGSTGPVKSI